MLIWISLAHGAEPMWQTCRQAIVPQTDVGLLGVEGPPLPRASVRADRAAPFDGARLVADASGWRLDGTPVDVLPPLGRVALFADRNLPTTEVVRLFQALHGSGADVWLARNAEWSPEGVTDAEPPSLPGGSRADTVDDWDAVLGRCKAGRALLEPATTGCGDLEARWDRVVRARSCRVEPRDRPGASLAATEGSLIVLQPLVLDPTAPTYWDAEQVLGQLRPDEGWIVGGSRPEGSYRDVGERDAWYLGRDVVVREPCHANACDCRVQVYVEPDGQVSRVEPVACAAWLLPDVEAHARSRRWDTWVGSEGNTRTVFVWRPGISSTFAEVEALRSQELDRGVLGHLPGARGG